MGNINELESRIKSVNANIAKLNSERNSNLARKKVYEEEFNKGCAEYNAKYGTSIDLSNIKEEYSRVQDYFTTKVGEMEQVIALVKEGRVAEAEAILKGVPEVEEQLPAEEPQVEAPQAQGTQAPPVAPTLVEAPTPTVENIPQAHTPVAPVAPQPQAQAPVAPVAPQPTAPAQGTVMEDDIMPRPTHLLFNNAVPPVAPTAPKAPTAPVAPTAPKAPTPVAPTPVASQPSASEVKIPTPVGVPSKPFTASEPVDPVGMGTVTSDIGAFDEILRQEQSSAVYAQNGEVPIGAVPTPPIGAVPTPPIGATPKAPTVPTAPTAATAPSQPIGAAPKPPVGAVPTPPPFPASLQGTGDEVSNALNFGDILSGTDFM